MSLESATRRLGVHVLVPVSGAFVGIRQELTTNKDDRLFSDEGKTYAFDNRAKSGFARGEGAGALILKPLDQALRDNDVIRSVIVNTGANKDGRTVGTC